MLVSTKDATRLPEKLLLIREQPIRSKTFNYSFLIPGAYQQIAEGLPLTDAANDVQRLKSDMEKMSDLAILLRHRLFVLASHWENMPASVPGTSLEEMQKLDSKACDWCSELADIRFKQLQAYIQRRHKGN